MFQNAVIFVGEFLQVNSTQYESYGLMPIFIQAINLIITLSQNEYCNKSISLCHTKNNNVNL